MQKALLILSFMSVSLFSMELEVVQHTQNAKKRHIDSSSTFTSNQLGSLDLYHGKKKSYVHQDDKKELGFALHSPLDIIDINAIVTRHLIQNNDDFAQAVHDVRAISLINKKTVFFFFSEQGAIDTIALTLSHKFKVNKPLVVKTLNMNASKQWLACFQKSINANDLLAQALINDDAGLALKALNSGADIDAFNPSLSDPALVYAVKLKPKMVRFLIKNGSDINIRSKQGETALIVASKCDDATNGMIMLNVINEFHPNKSLKDNNGLTAIDWVMLRS